MSGTDQPDPARALIQGFQEAGRVIGEWLEGMRPAFEQLTEIANRPEVRAAVERRAPLPARRPCHCLCGKTHPADKGICEGGSAVTTRRFETALTGPVDVPLCAPCAVAQGITEMVSGVQE
jgi:hypothetical protein